MIPTVTVDQMREVDRLMMEEVEISLLQMMENPRGVGAYCIRPSRVVTRPRRAPVRRW